MVLGTTRDGIHITQLNTLVQPVPNQRNQNPNLFRDPKNHRFYLTWYRGNDKDHFEIVSRNAASILDLDKAPDKVLLRSQETVAAPTLLYLKNARNSHGEKGVYYLATEIYPHRYTDNPQGEWRVKVSPPGRPMATSFPLKATRCCAASAPASSSTSSTDASMATIAIWKRRSAGFWRRWRRRSPRIHEMCGRARQPGLSS